MEASAGSMGDRGGSSFSGVLRRGVLGGSSCSGVCGGALTALRPILEGKGSEAQAIPKAEKLSWRAMVICYRRRFDFEWFLLVTVNLFIPDSAPGWSTQRGKGGGRKVGMGGGNQKP